MEFYEISNSEITIQVARRGAELILLQKKNENHNWLWAGGTLWNRSAPLLFPIVGRLKGEAYSYEGQTFHLSQHGFARDLDFEVLFRDDEKISLRLQADAVTLKSYPFFFELIVTYTLEKGGLKFDILVRNRDSKDMLFNFGWHPAFVLPNQKGELHLYVEGHLGAYHSLSNGLIQKDIMTSFAQETEISLEDRLFQKDALVFLKSQISQLSLKDAAGNFVTISGKTIPYLGLWTKDLHQFLCVEPWWGHADLDGASGRLDEKASIQRLSEGQQWESSLRIEIHSEHSKKPS